MVNHKHLTQSQHHDLQNILAKYEKHIDDSLGVCLQKKVHIDLLSGLEPVHHRVYPVPHIYEQTFKKGP